MINRSEGKKYTAWGRLWTKAVLCCFHKHITQFWENKSVTLNKHAFLQKWIWKYGFLIMITHNGYYPILPPEPDSIEPFDISLTVLMRGIPLGFSHRWALLTYLQTARTTVDDQFVSFGCIEDKNGAVDLSVVNSHCISSAPFLVLLILSTLYCILGRLDFILCLFLIVYFFSCFFTSGEIKSTVWTRQDSAGAWGHDTHFEGGQGFSLIHSQNQLLFKLSYVRYLCQPALVWSINASYVVSVSLVFLSRTSWSPCWMFPTSRWSSTEISQPMQRRLPISRNYYKRMSCTSGLKSPKSRQ